MIGQNKNVTEVQLSKPMNYTEVTKLSEWLPSEAVITSSEAHHSTGDGFLSLEALHSLQTARTLGSISFR